MISSWLDVVEVAVLLGAGLYHLQQGEARRQKAPRPWRGDVAALLTALCGGILLATGLVLLFYSTAFAWLSERAPLH